MKKGWILGAAVTAAAIASLWLSGLALADGPQPNIPEAHKMIQQYKGAATCLACHPNVGKQVAMSVHYQVAGVPKFVEGTDAGKPAGMIVSFSAAAATTADQNWVTLLQPKDNTKPVQPGGCALCHAGTGNKPNAPDKLTQADYDSIDCLICHGPDYKRTVVKDGDNFKIVPDPSIDVSAVARNAQKPTNEMCLRCHAQADGGLNQKHGTVPAPETDVHMAKGVTCTMCHTSKDHQIAGGSDILVQDVTNVKVDCSNCHTATPHKAAQGDRLNAHAAFLSCQVCHIPTIARDPKVPTATERDWTRPVIDLGTGLYGPTNLLLTNVTPEYRWWNRNMQSQLAPSGSRIVEGSKITPWKKTTYTVFSDAATNTLIDINSAVYATTGDVSAAVKKGAEDAKQAYSGQWKATSVTALYAINHQVAPADQALSCPSCHTPKGRIDFASLGFRSDEVARLTTLLTGNDSLLAPLVDPQIPTATALPAQTEQATTERPIAFFVGAGFLAAMVVFGAGLFTGRRR